eukprot:TRINITY_DN6711_c0_g1_i2.p1 TRINITY_DN6711_c0_g1~~TRINITY_DN6711_c0_g1_i2.p1  ORF type:complete len:393 (+),score=70.64 TRINITY_DN6711_c0_g1_i2:116-1294(+)
MAIPEDNGLAAFGYDLVDDHLAGGYESEIDPKPRKRFDADIPMPSAPTIQKPDKADFREEYDRNERIRHMRSNIVGMTAYERHQKFLHDFVFWYGDKDKYFRDQQPDRRNDYDVIREENRFIWSEQDQAAMTWEKQLAKRYHDKLFKEYCLVDLSRYKQGQFAMRWRVEAEVFEGKGHFICGRLDCSRREGLKTWEVNFSYNERGERRNALVKLRLCPKCSKKLNYHTKHREKRKQDTKDADITHNHTHSNRKSHDHSHTRGRDQDDHRRPAESDGRHAPRRNRDARRDQSGRRAPEPTIAGESHPGEEHSRTKAHKPDRSRASSRSESKLSTNDSNDHYLSSLDERSSKQRHSHASKHANKQSSRARSADDQDADDEAEPTDNDLLGATLL